MGGVGDPAKLWGKWTRGVAQGKRLPAVLPRAPPFPEGALWESLPWVRPATRRFLPGSKRFISPRKGVDLRPPLSQVLRRHTFGLLLSFLSQKAKYCICTREKLYTL